MAACIYIARLHDFDRRVRHKSGGAPSIGKFIADALLLGVKSRARTVHDAQSWNDAVVCPLYGTFK